MQKTKQVEVKLAVDGDIIRLRFKCLGHLATKSFSEMSVYGRKEAIEWLAEQFDDQLSKLKEAANGATR